MTLYSGKTLDELEALANAATEGPFAVESCGEKGDGSYMVGRVYGPDDEDCERPCSGVLPEYDKDGEPIEYYRDELVAECDFHNRNAYADAAFFAASRTAIPALIARIRELEQIAERFVIPGSTYITKDGK